MASTSGPDMVGYRALAISFIICVFMSSLFAVLKVVGEVPWWWVTVLLPVLIWAGILACISLLGGIILVISE